jgi:hypothetical protein
MILLAERWGLTSASGTNARIVSDSRNLQGAPAWAPDRQSITSAAGDQGVPHLFRVPVDGRFVIYSRPDIGTTFSVKPSRPRPQRIPCRLQTLTRGARRLIFVP